MKDNPIKAAHAGDTQYFTGLPCRNGHIAPRYTINSDCIECARERSKQNMRDRRSKLKQLMSGQTETV